MNEHHAQGREEQSVPSEQGSRLEHLDPEEERTRQIAKRLLARPLKYDPVLDGVPYSGYPLA